MLVKTDLLVTTGSPNTVIGKVAVSVFAGHFHGPRALFQAKFSQNEPSERVFFRFFGNDENEGFDANFCVGGFCFRGSFSANIHRPSLFSSCTTIGPSLS